MTAERRKRSSYGPFSAKTARELCRRVAAGETVAAICAEPGMPSVTTIGKWVKQHPTFGRIYAQARALGGREGWGKTNSYCPVLAHEIVARVSEGEGLSAIAADARMPSLRTIFRWRHYEPDFAEALDIARAAVAERFSDFGWTLAMEASPETAFLTQVRLTQLRWMTGVLSPRTHGRMRPVEAPRAPEVTQVLLRSYRTEVNPETGQVRSVSQHYDPDIGVVSEPDGPWKDPPFPLVKEVDYFTAKARRLELGMDVTSNSMNWDMRPSAVDDPQG